MQNKDKSMKQKVSEYMEILGVHVPDEQAHNEQAHKADNPDEDTARQSTGSVV